MKKSIISLASIALIAISFNMISCQSAEKRVDDAEEELLDAKQDLEESAADMKADTQDILNAEAWKEYKDKSEQKIKDYENRIAELKAKMKISGKLLDTYYEQRIIALENNVIDLKTRLISQEKSQSSWGSFKREFNHDMDELGKAISNFNEDDKK